MQSLAKILFILLVLGLHGCASLSSHDADTSSEEIRAVQAQLQGQPKDIALNRQLIGLYLNKFNDNKSRRVALLLIEQAEKYLILNPDDEPVKLVLYEFLAREALSRHSEQNLPRLRVLFNDSSLLKQTTYVPPSAIQAYILLDSRLNDENKRLLKKSLHAAIKENPNYTKSYRMLSSIYRLEKRFTLAIAILRQSENVNANDPTLYKEIGDLYLEKAEARAMCFIEDQDNMRKALQVYRKVARLKPDDPQSHEDLANLYHWTRKIPLYLHEAKRRYELDQKSIEARRDYVGSLFWRNPHAALPQINQLLQDVPNDVLGLGLMTRYYFVTGQWQQALKVSQAQRNSAEKDEFYRLLREYLILRKLGKSEEAKEFFTDKTSQIKLLDWEVQLTKYHLGELSKQELLSKANDLCKKTEAYFYIGFDHWLKGDTGQARYYFNTTLAHGHPAYLEYLAAKNLLPLLNGLVAYSSPDQIQVGH